jgi:hypothetical protein
MRLYWTNRCFFMFPPPSLCFFVGSFPFKRLVVSYIHYCGTTMDQTVIYITMNYLAAICNLCAHRPQHHPHYPHYIVIALDVMSHLFHIFRNKHSEVQSLLIKKNTLDVAAPAQVMWFTDGEVCKLVSGTSRNFTIVTNLVSEKLTWQNLEINDRTAVRTNASWGNSKDTLWLLHW